MSTVSTAEEDYRGYRLQAVRVFAHWQIAIYPMREDLPFSLPDDLPSAPSLDEAFGKARWRVDRLLEAARRR
jgi:hypothetical protein